MEKIINDFSLGILAWQIILLCTFIFIVYFIVKLYKKINEYLERK